MKDNFRSHSRELKEAIDGLEPWYHQVEEATELIREAFASGKSLYVAGNGGSATLAQHMSDEFVGKYESDRKAYPVVALTADGAVLTVIGNDYGYENIFSRQLEALGHEGDIFIGFSTSGTSANIVEAARVAKKKNMKIISFTGNKGVFKDMADVAVISPAKATSRIQELDLHAIHLICEAFEPEEKKLRLGMERVDELMGSFTQKRVLIIGDAMLDRHVSGVVERVNPEAPALVLRNQHETETSGGAGNAAKNVAGLGAQAVLVSVVGDDITAQQLQKAAENEGYTTRFVTDAARPTIVKTRFLAKIRESEAMADPAEGSQQVLRVDSENRDSISSDVEQRIMKEVEALIADGVDGIIVSDYDKGVVTPGLASAIMDVARKHHIPVAADLKPSNAPLFKGATIMTPNRKESHEFLGLDPIADPQDPAELSAKISKEMDTNTFVTLGPDGMYVCSGEVHEQVPQEHVVKVYDVSGAGDTAIATILLCKLAGASALESARIANAAGAVVVSKSGTVSITSDELKSKVLHRK